LAIPDYTSPGENKIGTEIFKAMPDKIKQQFFEFLEVCWTYKWIPPEFVTEFRPIALSLVSEEISPPTKHY